MGQLYDTIRNGIERVLDAVKRAKADGTVTVAEIFEIGREVMATVFAAIDAIDALPGDKHAAVAAACRQAYDDLIAPIDIPTIPNLFEGIVDNCAAKAIEAAVKAGLDAMFPTSGAAEG